MSYPSSVTVRRTDPTPSNPVEDDRHTQMAVASTNSRRGAQSSFSLIKLIGAVGTIAVGLWMTYGYQYEKVIDPLDFKSRTERVLATTPLIDGHNDLPYLLRIELKNKIYDESILNFRESKCSRPFIFPS
jgi:hypothetical protein